MRKTALITGSSRGIGAATARALAEAGYAVCINYIEQQEKAEALVADLREKGHTAICCQADVADATAVRAMTDMPGKSWAASPCLSTMQASPGRSSFRISRRRPGIGCLR